MLEILNTIISFCDFIYLLTKHIFTFCTEYIPSWLAMITTVFGVAKDYTPYGLSAVALICLSTMLIRFIYNAVRGSGA